MQELLPHKFYYNYHDLIQAVELKKERPKFFAQQLQVTLLISNSLMEVFEIGLLQKFSHKLRTVYESMHLNIIIMIDIILDSCNANPKDNFHYINLRKLIGIKLKNKLKP